MTAKKIAILGGGISALTTALELSNEPDWKERYDITIYQMGWRLGGKGASSRNESASNRIEEHGLHIWLGFYENAFALIRKCYAELDRPAGTPLATWRDAFKPHSFIVLEDQVEGQWSHWAWNLPTNERLPGDGGDIPTIWDFLVMAIQWVEEKFKDELAEALTGVAHPPVGPHPSWWGGIFNLFGKGLETAAMTFGEIVLKIAKRKAASMSRDPNEHSAHDHQVLHWLSQRFAMWLHELRPEIEQQPRLRHAYILIDIVITVVRGAFADGVMFHGLEALDQLELRQWLKKHGASDLTLESAPVRVGYDLAFSYEDGDPQKPNMAAGTAVRGIFRMMFTYKGAVLWKMQAGMGETVFTPIYEVLKQRGVNFRFFHRVDSLHLSEARNAIESISLTRQATATGEYDPLVSVGGYKCWPAHPQYDQLEEGDELKNGEINLESFWAPWEGTEKITLRQGEDFDLVVLGIPIAALRSICAELLEASSRWRNMCGRVKTVQTQGFQVWLQKDLAGVGWTLQSPILSAYTEPMDTWVDMTHLLDAEGWDVANRPQQLAYFCGVMNDAAKIPDQSDLDFPHREYERARMAAVEYLRQSALYLWPSVEVAGQDPFDWDVLSAPSGVAGPDRFSHQYWRPNIDPSERYVLSVAGSTQYRLEADQSGFSNLYLTGDWIRNGFDTPGCIESAVISGRQAARAISGRAFKIVGESDF
jgi:uncharacterized protein with NAD-binding domain and iron-sulfur cluster